MPKFEKIEVNKVYYDVHPRDRSIYYPVEIITISPKNKSALVCWNGNKKNLQTYCEKQIQKLQIKEPK